jgi:hypothetical protein
VKSYLRAADAEGGCIPAVILIAPPVAASADKHPASRQSIELMVVALL